jgi:hypothetical protein
LIVVCIVVAVAIAVAYVIVVAIIIAIVVAITIPSPLPCLFDCCISAAAAVVVVVISLPAPPLCADTSQFTRADTTPTMLPTWSVSRRRHGADMLACVLFWGEKIHDTTPTLPAKPTCDISCGNMT